MRLRQHLLGDGLLVLNGCSIVLGQRLQPRQTANTTNFASASPSFQAPVTSSATVSAPPCCIIWPGFQGVKVNSWYTEPVKQYIATVITTFINYNNNTVLTANSTTVYLPKTEIFDVFSYYGPASGGWPFSATALTAVPSTLVPEGYLGPGNYGATTVVRGNETVATFPFTDLQIPSPTPYALYESVNIFTWTPEDPTLTTLPAEPTMYDRNLCGTTIENAWLAYQSGTWITSTTTGFAPPSSIIFSLRDQVGPMGIGSFPVVVPLPTPMPNYGVYVDLPAGVSSSIVANQTLLSLYPWVTNCFTYGGEGQPTVHIPVDQLTTDSSTTIQRSAAPVVVITSTTLSTSSSAPPPKSSVALPPTTSLAPPSTSSVALPLTTALGPPSTSIAAGNDRKSSTSSYTPTPGKLTTTPQSSTADHPKSAAVASSNEGGSDTSQIVKQSNTSPSVPSSTAAASSNEVDSQKAAPGPQTSNQAATSGDQIAGATTTQIVSYQPLGSTAAVVGSTTLAVGGAYTLNGETLSLIMQSSGVAVVLDGSTTIVLSSNSVMSGSQVVTLVGPARSVPAGQVNGGTTTQVISCQPLGSTAAVFGSTTLTVGGAFTQNDQTFSLIAQSGGVAIVVDKTATYALPSGTAAPGSQLITLVGPVNPAPTEAIINGITLTPGAASVIDGHTVSLLGTNLVVASGSITTTQNLGGYILSGINGKPSSTGSSISTAVNSTAMPYKGTGSTRHGNFGVLLRDSLLMALGYLILL